MSKSYTIETISKFIINVHNILQNCSMRQGWPSALRYIRKSGFEPDILPIERLLQVVLSLSTAQYMGTETLADKDCWHQFLLPALEHSFTISICADLETGVVFTYDINENETWVQSYRHLQQLPLAAQSIDTPCDFSPMPFQIQDSVVKYTYSHTRCELLHNPQFLDVPVHQNLLAYQMIDIVNYQLALYVVDRYNTLFRLKAVKMQQTVFSHKLFQVWPQTLNPGEVFPAQKFFTWYFWAAYTGMQLLSHHMVKAEDVEPFAMLREYQSQSPSYAHNSVYHYSQQARIEQCECAFMTMAIQEQCKEMYHATRNTSALGLAELQIFGQKIFKYSEVKNPTILDIVAYDLANATCSYFLYIRRYNLLSSIAAPTKEALDLRRCLILGGDQQELRAFTPEEREDLVPKMLALRRVDLSLSMITWDHERALEAMQGIREAFLWNIPDPDRLDLQPVNEVIWNQFLARSSNPLEVSRWLSRLKKRALMPEITFIT